MDIICLPRGDGKTTELVKRAAADGCPIIITTSYKDYIRDIADGLGVDMPTVYSFREFANAAPATSTSPMPVLSLGAATLLRNISLLLVLPVRGMIP